MLLIILVFNYKNHSSNFSIIGVKSNIPNAKLFEPYFHILGRVFLGNIVQIKL